MRSAVTVMALATAAVLATGPATAAPAGATTRTWTVRPGGGVIAKAGATTLKDTTTGSVVNCQSSDMSGTVKPGSGLPGAGIGSVTAASYRCFGPTGAPRLMPSGLPWQLNLTSYDAGTGVSRGTISHVRLAFSIFNCSAVVGGAGATSGGEVTVTYANKTGKLKLLANGGTLHWYRVHKCAGLLASGDPASLTGSYVLTPKQVITSP
ncbi:MAG TPA: hypothetical protein VGI05_04390 [Streptosporangiaceae bacterium]|jgi:hypothetical protein